MSNLTTLGFLFLSLLTTFSVHGQVKSEKGIDVCTMTPQAPIAAQNSFWGGVGEYIGWRNREILAKEDLVQAIRCAVNYGGYASGMSTISNHYSVEIEHEDIDQISVLRDESFENGPFNIYRVKFPAYYDGRVRIDSVPCTAKVKINHNESAQDQVEIEIYNCILSSYAFNVNREYLPAASAIYTLLPAKETRLLKGSRNR